MLSENIRTLRKAKGLSQQDLANELNVVRQTVSKWEKGLSVPDAGILIRIAEALDTSVDMLLGESVPEPDEKSEIRIIAERLEAINRQLANQAEKRRKIWRIIWCFAIVTGILMAARSVIMLCYGIHANSAIQYSAGIIGGADGPTSILIRAETSMLQQSIFAAAVLLVSIIGIVRTKRK